MITVFCHLQGIIYTGSQDKGKSFTELYTNYWADLTLIRRKNGEEKGVLPQSRSLAHTSAITTVKFFEIGYELVFHPLYMFCF